jgi:aspartyl protease family protein
VNGEDAPRTVYLLLLLMLVAASLVGMRLPAGKVVKMALAWVAIFAGIFAVFAFRDEFSALGQKLRAEATGEPIVAGRELRVPIAEDGHFWVEAAVNGEKTRFLIDSGASITTISHQTARSAGIEPGIRIPVNTANGTIAMARGTAERFAVGPIQRSDFTVHVNSSDATNVIGMNFLSSLRSWSVQGNYLVLQE